jgi:hypothetical protein
MREEKSSALHDEYSTVIEIAQGMRGCPRMRARNFANDRQGYRTVKCAQPPIVSILNLNPGDPDRKEA